MLYLYFIFCTYLKFSLICYSDTFLKLAVMVIIKLLHLWVTFLNSAACISSFCSLPQAGKVYYTYFIGMKTEVQSSKVTSLWVREVVNSKAGARNSIFGFLALFLSILSLSQILLQTHARLWARGQCGSCKQPRGQSSTVQDTYSCTGMKSLRIWQKIY